MKIRNWLAGAFIAGLIAVAANAQIVSQVINSVAVGGITGLGTSVATALGINVGSAGAVLVKGTSVCADLSNGATGCAVAISNPTASTSGNLSSCGGSPNLTSVTELRVGTVRISSGLITTGSAAIACTLTFAVAFSVNPMCLVASQAGVGPPSVGTTGSLALTTASASTNYNYTCVGTP